LEGAIERVGEVDGVGEEGIDGDIVKGVELAAVEVVY
jgi:hypothetical protein